MEKIKDWLIKNIKIKIDIESESMYNYRAEYLIVKILIKDTEIVSNKVIIKEESF